MNIYTKIHFLLIAALVSTSQAYGASATTAQKNSLSPLGQTIAVMVGTTGVIASPVLIAGALNKISKAYQNERITGNQADLLGLIAMASPAIVTVGGSYYLATRPRSAL